MKKQIYAVLWRPGTWMKAREFETIEEARSFAGRLQSNRYDYQILRCYRESWWQALTQWKMQWFGFELYALVVACVGFLVAMFVFTLILKGLR